MRVKCKDCKHWSSPKDGYQGGDTGHGSCNVLASSDGDVDGEALAYVLDGEHYSADLYCKPEFGCLLWEVK